MMTTTQETMTMTTEAAILPSELAALEKHLERAREHEGFSDAEVCELLGIPAEALERATAQAATKTDLRVSGGVATIPVHGVLLSKANRFLDLFGVAYSHYPGIQAQISEANGSDDVESIRLEVNSPGGLIRGMFATGDAIRASAKPVHAVVDGVAASAAYHLASQAKTLRATNRDDVIGSVGVVANIRVDESVVAVTSTAAPEKRPDVTTSQGQAMVRKHLDGVHVLMATDIAKGRGVTVAKVNRDFGRGNVLLAADAEKAGMIDGMVAEDGRGENSRATVRPMDLAALEREHQDVYAAAVARGVAQERVRVSAHLKAGEAFGVPELAAKLIADGQDAAACTLIYATAERAKAKATERETENAPPLAGAPAGGGGADPMDAVYAEVGSQFGVKFGGK
jgi:ClpP class serine protease